MSFGAKRPRIVHVIVAGAIGGAERVIVNLASRPEETGAEHCLALMTPNPKLRAYFANAGLKVRDRGPVRENPLAYLWRSLGPSDIAWLSRIVEEEGATCLHAHTYGSHTLAVRAGLRAGIPVMRTEHGIAHYADPSCVLFRRWALRNTDLVIAVSQFVRDVIEKYDSWSSQKVRVIPNGIDLSYFSPAPPTTGETFTLAITSRLAAIKQLDLAIEAVAQVPNIRLHIAGDGEELERLEALSRRLGVDSRVRFFGHLDDPRPVVAACDAVINCTKVEAHPLAIIEAAAMARPAIAFAGGGMPEIVQERRTGWLVRDSSPDAFARAVAEASADRTRAAAFGQNARAFVEARFGVGSMCEGYASAYGNLSEPRCARPGA